MNLSLVSQKYGKSCIKTAVKEILNLKIILSLFDYFFVIHGIKILLKMYKGIRK